MSRNRNKSCITRKDVRIIKVFVFPIIPIVIIAALVFLGDRAMEFSLIRREVALAVIIVSLPTLLVLVLRLHDEPLLEEIKHRLRIVEPEKEEEN